MEKKAGLSQPLGLRRDYGKDYDEVESTMLKPDLPELDDAMIKETRTYEIVPKKMDYDGSPIDSEEHVKTEGMDLECPVCNDVNKFIPDGDEDQESDTVILCPKCANAAHISDFVKTASGKFTAKVATCLDNDFKAIRKILPKKDEITLSGKNIAELHKRLDKIYETYRKFEKELGK